jgi:hypothetical protein
MRFNLKLVSMGKRPVKTAFRVGAYFAHP